MLESLSIFKKLKEDDIKTLEENLKILKFRKRETIFNEGDTPKWFHILIKGRIKISKFSKNAKEIILEILDAPDFFGTLALLKNIPYPASAIAVDECVIGNIPSHIFLQIVNKYPELQSEILHHITTRLRSGIETLKDIALVDVLSRVVYQILKLANKYGKKISDGILIDLKLTKQDIAEMAGTTTETAIRIISKLKKEGYIVEQNRKIIIKDIERLLNLIKD
ncbi:MAG: Crp/Fnr family transcriptional regulator [Elusimicrobiota bacterium]|nr:Crp/Fnr family transcriptional regulator [Endomicrobiia bacterium]MCX7723651.1 Crp/Fnr family transcriptional regulator [Thermodesulfovibrio sp.]MDW8166741.1 Crp/Fnr family transcriptional regulator [Elusimicrobiota bacterium]